MEQVLYCVLYSCLGLVLLVSIRKKNKRLSFVGSYSGFVFGMLIYYILIPIIAFININELSIRYIAVNTYILSKDIHFFIYALSLVLIAFVSLNVIYNITINKQNITHNIEIEIKKESIIKILSVIAYATCFIGGVSFIIFIASLGGIVNALKIADINRSFSSSLTDFVDYNYSLLIIPARLITVSPFLFFLLGSLRKKVFDRFFFVFSFLISISFFLFNAGRAPLIIFLLSFLYVILSRYFKKIWLKLVLVGVISLPLLDFLDSLFIYFGTNQWVSYKVDYLKYTYQLIHPFKNILNIPDITSEYGLNFGSDFITSFLNFIPGVNFPKSYENTSLFFSGGNWMVVGGVPNDPITFGYIQFGLAGVVMVFGFLGFLLARIDAVLRKLPNNNATKLICSILVTNMFILISSADLEAVLRGNVIVVILSFCLLSISKFVTPLRNKS
ncbi:O-antigen polymerase [Cohnella massiliensis]|uniref:O-antigen polymerase n=1 Tax=Cohnella massiliensis TaxID=1816691 RepID=UPI0009B94858|nr:O-antigen polymerase [Cohnella massiliensis]